MLNESGLKPMPFVPLTLEEGIDIDTIDLLYEIEDVPEDEKERQDWYDENYFRINSELEDLNTNIEDYLREIDSEHGTEYSPTGKSRVFKNGGDIGNNDKVEINIFTLFEGSETDTYIYNEIFTSLEDAHDFAKTLDTQFEGQDSNILINHYQLNNL
jgi:hypothetical protein